MRGAFDRPAFKGPYLWHSDHQAFQEAIATTLKVVKTGKLFDRHGQELQRVEGRYVGSFLVRNLGRRKALQRDETVRMLNLIWKDLDITEMRLPTEYAMYEETRDPGA